MGRRKPAAAFSLFSFQDIITSVTAILILVMILLTVELVTRRRQQATADPEVTRRQLEAAVSRLEALVSQARDAVAARRAQCPHRTREAAEGELARMVVELDAARRRLAEAERTRDAVAQLLASAEAQAAASAAEVERLAALQRQLEADKAESDRLETTNREEKERQQKRRREIADTPRSGTELVFNPPADSDRRAWLVELSVDGATAVLLGGDRIVRLGPDVDTGNAAADWIAALTADGDYCLLLVRPSAPKHLARTLERRLGDAGIRFGIDLIGEDQTVRDGSQPARKTM